MTMRDPNLVDFDDPDNIEDNRGFNFGGLLNSVLNTGGEIARGYLGKKQPQQATQPKPMTPVWIMPALIGGGLLVVLLFAGVLIGGRK